MIKNYFKIAWRNLVKNKAFSTINILGLALGMTCSIIIFLWVQDERSIDAFHENGDRIYAVTSREYTGDQVFGSYDTPGLLANELKKVIPEIELACNTGWNEYKTFSTGEKTMKIQGDYAGADFFKIFSYPLLFGSKETVLTTPESIAISRKMAVNLFGSPENAYNNTIKFDNYRDLKITGVFEDLGENVSEKFEYIVNWDLFIERHEWAKDWGNSGPNSYVMIKAGTDPYTVESKIQHFIGKYDKDYSEIGRLELGLQQYDKKYLYSTFKNGYISGGRIEYVRLFSIVAVFILLIACINFMNLSTARSIKRAKEIGVRKVVGAIRPALVKQFLAEALVYTLLAVLASLILLIVLLPSFNNLTGKQIEFPLNSSYFWFGIVLLIFFASVVSGSYPAFLLSSFKPISVLKTNFKLNPTSGFFRKGLVVFQFTLSILFIVGMLVVSKQVNYIQTKNLGYHKNNLIYLPITGTMQKNFDLFKHKAIELPGVKKISQISQRPVEVENTTSSVEWKGKIPNSKLNFVQTAVGYDFIETMQAEMVLGRDFSRNFADSTNYIVNETALQKIGYTDPIGKPLTFWGTKGTIIGVVKDFHFNSLHNPIAPLVIRLMKNESWGVALIRTEPGQTHIALNGLEKLHKEINPEFPFAHQFADEEYAFLYKSEQVAQKISKYFAFLAIFISCLGLLGLVIFTSEQRKREISIRKILGADIRSLLELLTKDFLILIGTAFIITVPVAFLAMQKWLENFEYRVNINWIGVFALAGMAVLFISLLMVGFQVIKTAITNPVKGLRTE